MTKQITINEKHVKTYKTEANAVKAITDLMERIGDDAKNDKFIVIPQPSGRFAVLVICREAHVSDYAWNGFTVTN